MRRVRKFTLPAIQPKVRLKKPKVFKELKFKLGDTVQVLEHWRHCSTKEELVGHRGFIGLASTSSRIGAFYGIADISDKWYGDELASCRLVLTEAVR